MEVGKKYTITETVTEAQLAKNVGSGCVEVFATPMMIALIEKTAAACVQDALPQGDSTVGTAINVSHVAATPVGMQVTATAEVTAVEGRVITFAVRAEDEAGLIGEGTHQRVVIHVNRFEEKAKAKKA